MEEILTTCDAAKMLGRSVDRVRDYEREGKLPAGRTRSGQRIFKASDVEALARQCRRLDDHRERKLPDHAIKAPCAAPIIHPTNIYWEDENGSQG